MRKFVLKCMLILFICSLLIFLANFIFEANNGHYTYHMMNEMYQCEDNIDVVFLGSSHVYRSYDPKLADKLLGLKTFNAGSSSQGMNTSYYLLKEICDYHDVKTVYLDTYYGIANLPENDAQVFLISDFMKNGKNKLDLLYSNGGIKTVINAFMSFRRNKNNLHVVRNLKSKSLAVNDYSTVIYPDEEYRGDGFVYSYIVAEADEESTYSSYAGNTDLRAKKPVSDLYYESLIDIIFFCQDNNIELVLVNQPMPRKTTDYVKGYNNYIQYLSQIADSYGIEYWNFDLYKYDMGLSMDCYKDGGHLNGGGAEKYTEFFCKYVKDFQDGKITADAVFYKDY